MTQVINESSDFDLVLDRRHSDSAKWNRYGDDVLPLWVADMDFAAPPPVIQALRERVEHGVFGYAVDPRALREVFVQRLASLYGWRVSADALVFVPGVVPGFHLACRSFLTAGQGLLIQTPVYPPILHAAEAAGLRDDQMELTRDRAGDYSIDVDRFEESVTGHTGMFMLCNPHNPVGRAFRRDELEQMAAICLRHDLLICSDDIHCDFLYPGHSHIPMASLSPEVERRTVTLFAPSKTFNIAGLRLAVAVIPDADLRRRFRTLSHALAGEVSQLGVVAALAAYRDSQEWLNDLLVYLRANRDLVFDYVKMHMPGVTMNKPEATYLAWLDCRQAGSVGDNPHHFFLEQARVAVNNGASFGRGGAGFVRLNFGCPRALLLQALDRMRDALRDHAAVGGRAT